MSTATPQPVNDPQPAPPVSQSDPGPVQMLSVSIALQTIAQRMAAVEAKLDKAPGPTADKGAGSTLLEFAKVVFGGWPALGLIFLILFYFPLRDALNAIPDKVRSASEIGLMGVSLKSTIQVEATRLGVGNLSESIPKLSNNAIEVLLRTPKSLHSSLISYTLDNFKVSKVYMPGPEFLSTLAELESQKLITVRPTMGGRALTSAEQINELFNKFRADHPGQETPANSDGFIGWELTDPLPNGSLTISTAVYELTPLGEKAIDVVINAVSSALSAPSPAPNH